MKHLYVIAGIIALIAPALLFWNLILLIFHCSFGVHLIVSCLITIMLSAFLLLFQSIPSDSTLIDSANTIKGS